jgi:hypothetical protein
MKIDTPAQDHAGRSSRTPRAHVEPRRFLAGHDRRLAAKAPSSPSPSSEASSPEGPHGPIDAPDLPRWTSAMHTAARALADVDHASGREAIEAAMRGTHRALGAADRDRYRHPADTLDFFGFTPTMTVLDIAPDPGLYTELLPPALAKHGAYLATVAGLMAPCRRGRGWKRIRNRYSSRISFYCSRAYRHRSGAGRNRRPRRRRWRDGRGPSQGLRGRGRRG